MKNTLIILFVLATSATAHGQKYMTRTGVVKFFSKTSVEDIEAVNNQVSSVIDLGTGDMAFTMLMKAFTFEKALMQEHFNEKYVQSDKFPKATFKGSIVNHDKLTLGSEPKEVTVKGTLTIHGKSKEIETKAKLSSTTSGVKGTATFNVNPEDYDIEIPSAVSDNISRSIEVTVNMNYDKM